MSHIGIITAWNYAWSVLTACFVLGVAIFLLAYLASCCRRRTAPSQR